jgi:hypothetical protein
VRSLGSMFLTHKGVEFCDFLPRNFQRDRIGLLCQPLLKPGRDRAVARRLGKHYAVMAVRVKYDCGKTVRTLWFDTVPNLIQLAHDISQIRIDWLD